MDNKNNNKKQVKDLQEQLIKLVGECEQDLCKADEQLKEIYKQYDIDVDGLKEAETLAILGGHINKTAELRLKAVGEKVKLVDLLHRISSEMQQMDIAEAMAKAQMEEDSEEVYYEHTDDDDQKIADESTNTFIQNQYDEMLKEKEDEPS
jgi:hypothetical protein